VRAANLREHLVRVPPLREVPDGLHRDARVSAVRGRPHTSAQAEGRRESGGREVNEILMVCKGVVY